MAGQNKSTFALFFANRGFFPGSLMAEARRRLPKVLKSLGHKSLMMPAAATRNGAVETLAEARAYADWLRQNEGRYDGVILTMPNFGDENGAVAALQDANVPIFIHAWPDELDKMQPETRRDAFCGKFSIMDVFCQNEIPFTALAPHTVSIDSPRFAENIDHFDRICRVVKGLRRMRLGAIGARTSPFKTVRIDEATLEKYGVTVETFDLSDVFDRMERISARRVASRARKLKGIADWTGVPAGSLENIARLGVVLDEIIEENELDAVAVRCWTEMQKIKHISPCVLMGELNDRGVPAACEVDVGNAVAMRALSLATYNPPMCLDWNNNYRDEDDKCIMFHCGPIPKSLMAGRGKITDHAIITNETGKGTGFGCNTGRIKPGPFTFGSLMTADGEAYFYLGEGQFTKDRIPAEFFGCAGVAKIHRLQDVLLHVGRNGHRHHVSASPGNVLAPLCEALGYYLGYDVSVPQLQ